MSKRFTNIRLRLFWSFTGTCNCNFVRGDNYHDYYDVLQLKKYICVNLLFMLTLDGIHDEVHYPIISHLMETKFIIQDLKKKILMWIVHFRIEGWWVNIVVVSIVSNFTLENNCRVMEMCQHEHDHVVYVLYILYVFMSPFWVYPLCCLQPTIEGYM